MMTTPIDQNPESFFPVNILSVSQKEKPWRVAHTKSRREKALAHYLRQTEIGYYLPMFKKRQPGQNRSRFSLMPVFNGYLFFRADEFERHKALRSNHIARIIEVGDEEKLIDELLQIQKMLSGNTPVYPYDFINEGQRVRVKNGPLKDLEGWIVRKDRKLRLVISVESIMQSVSVTIDADQVEPVSS
jgi:transcription antitermination factor NusG